MNPTGGTGPAPHYPLLETIDLPASLRRLRRTQLQALAFELRDFLLQTVARTGGHLAANLGTVELAIALHFVFDTPHDRLVWDVGHQSYPHKILTGRRRAMHTIKQAGGLSGFPKRSESEYDTFGTGHSSTSVSAALGMAIASRAKGEQLGAERRRHVAIIGDGAMSAGMAFEALNNAGVHADLDLLVVLNDNDMSISPAVGALNRYLARLMSGRIYSRARDMGKAMLSHLPEVLDFARKVEEHAKGMVAPSTLFEEFGFNYVGPIDGHDLDALVPTLQNMRELRGPQFLHVVTRKGKGYAPAERDPVLYHGPGRFDPARGVAPASAGVAAATPKPANPTYTQVFSEWICDEAARDERLIAITPAMREGSGLVEFERRFPGRYFDVGIAEQHAVTFAGGLACEALKPVVAIYSTFLQRGYDQLIHDIALQNLPVLFALDRAGLVGADGATHAGAYDIAYLRCIPNMLLMAPSDEDECRQMLHTGFLHEGPAAVRYPRGAGPGTPVRKSLEEIPIGKGRSIRAGHQVAILAFGSMLAPARRVAERRDLTLVDMRFIKPLDEALLVELAQRHRAFVSVEEHALAGGAGSAVAEALSRLGINLPILMLGLPDRFVDHGDHAQLLAAEGLDAPGIEKALTRRFPELFSEMVPLRLAQAHG